MHHPIIIRSDGINPAGVKALDVVASKHLATTMVGGQSQIAVIANPSQTGAQVVARLRSIADDIENAVITTPLD